MTIPTIPTIRLDDPDETATVQTLRKCCLENGFFYLGGHGMEDMFSTVFAESARFFALPVAEKKRLYEPEMSRGYTVMGGESLDPQHQPDTKEGFYIGNHIPKDDPRYNPSKLKGPNVWPTPDNCSLSDCQRFQTIMEEYFKKVAAVGLRVVRLLALAIGLDDKHAFDSSFKDTFATIRLLHYAAVPSQTKEGLFACGAHTDYGMITLLLTDQNPGLQIQTLEGDWVDVPPRIQEGLFIVNLGDMLERWTNGMFRSTNHRVLTTGDKERYSIPFFFEPDFDTEVKCLDVCTSKDHPPKYPPTTSGQHLLGKYNQTRSDFQSSE
jgi:isopenicillin N synthase-like dioxygenase